MRTTKVLLAAAVAAVGIGTSLAQVTSVNVVGFVNLTLRPGYTMIANQLNASNNNNNVNIVLPNPPDGAQLYKWDSVNQTYVAIDAAGGLWIDADFNPSPASLNPGEGAFFFNPLLTTVTMTLVGEVPQSTVAQPNLVVSLPGPGYGLVSSIVPQSVGLSTIGLTAPAARAGMQYYSFDAAVQGYRTTLEFDAVGGTWVDADFNVVDPTPAVGEGFFIFNPGATTTWTRQFNVN